MLDTASEKLAKFNYVKFILADFHTYKITGKYDAIVSSLALHHLESEKHRDLFYKNIYASLTRGGIFINADILKSDDPHFNSVNMAKWKEFGLRSLPEDFIENTTFVNIKKKIDARLC